MESIVPHTTLVVISREKAIFHVPLKLSRMSGYLKACEELCEINCLHREPINLETIKGRTLEMVFDWMARHRGDAKEMQFNCRHIFGLQNVRESRWDEAFFGSMNDEALYSLRDAAHFLRINKLKDTVEKKISCRFRKLKKLENGILKNSTVNFKCLVEEKEDWLGNWNEKIIYHVSVLDSIFHKLNFGF